MQINSTVQYRDIPGFVGYKAGSDGTIWSCWIRTSAKGHRGLFSFQSSKWKAIKPTRSNFYGHLRASLRTDQGVRCNFLIHRLILLTFIGECPDGCECRHLDGNPTNNRLDNLCWGTRQENHADKNRHGTWQGGEANGNSKLTEAQVIAIRAEYANGKTTHRKLAKDYGLGRRTVADILNRRMWFHLS